MKSAIVFGGSGFLGREIVSSLAGCGCFVTCTYRTRRPVFTGPIAACVSALPCDIGDAAQVSEVFRQAVQSAGTPDAVINAAGIACRQSLLADTDTEDILSLIRTDLTGALFISREAAKVMHEKQAGSIIHVSSMWGSAGASCEVPYSAAKGGLNAMVRALAKELAPDGIRVNAVAPGLLLSPMNAHLSQEELELFRAETPLNCYITPADVFAAIRYLMDSPHVTGQILAVDGGIVI